MMPAMITAQPAQPSVPRRSPAIVNPKSAAQAGSIVKASAVLVAEVRRCAHVCTRKASALANTPVTSRAPHPVHPRGTPTCRGRGRRREDRQTPRPSPQERARRKAGPAECAHAPRRRHRQGHGRDRESQGKESEQRVERHGVLDLDERDSPDRGDDDQREERQHPAIVPATSVHATIAADAGCARVGRNRPPPEAPFKIIMPAKRADLERRRRLW
jgi:hypothetical protein